MKRSLAQQIVRSLAIAVAVLLVAQTVDTAEAGRKRGLKAPRRESIRLTIPQKPPRFSSGIVGPSVGAQ